MSEHVGHELVDLLAGRCTPERRRQIEAHLRGCETCAAERSWAERFRDDAMRDGVGHPSALRLVELSAPETTPTAAERQHLESCGECGRELEWLRRLPEEGSLEAEAEAPEDPEASRIVSRGRRWRRWVWPVLATAGAAALLLFVLLPDGTTRDLSQLARIEPLPVEITRDVPGPGSFDEALRQGLALYADGDFAGARETLQRALTLKEDDTADLYLASTELLLGMSEQATSRLRALIARDVDEILHEEAVWQLANVELARGSTVDAKRDLERVIELAGHHRAEARELLAAIESAGG